jgi:prepilin-type processing-associated H-X9-DG protein
MIPGNWQVTSGGYLPTGQTPSATVGNPSWVAGSFGTALDGASDSPSGCSTNVYYLGVSGDSIPGVGILVGSIGGYVKGAGSYKCPADRSLDTHWLSPRVRSASANMMVGMSPYELSQSAGKFGVDSRFRNFYKYSDFNAGLSAVGCFDILDENPLSLNDGYFEYVPAGDNINDRPAVNHGSSSSFSYCDGHVALHKWVDAFLNIKSTYAASQQDPKWLAVHGTVER